jgi:hypothetical protein
MLLLSMHEACCGAANATLGGHCIRLQLLSSEIFVQTVRVAGVVALTQNWPVSHAS